MKSNYQQALPHEWNNMARVFVAMGDEHRQRMLLMFEPGERLNVGQVVAASPLSRSAVSHHLKILREAGVLESEKIGKEVWFWINKDFLLETLHNVTQYIQEEA